MIQQLSCEAYYAGSTQSLSAISLQHADPTDLSRSVLILHINWTALLVVPIKTHARTHTHIYNTTRCVIITGSA